MDMTRGTADLVSRLHAAILSPGEWSAAIGALNTSFGGSHAICFEGGRIGAGDASRAMAVGIDAAALAPLLSARARKLAEPWDRCVSPRRALSSADVMSDDEVMGTDLYQEFIKPAGGFHALTIGQDDSASRFQLTFCRSRREGGFVPEETARLQRLLPHLSIVFELRNRLAAADAVARDLAGLLDQCRDGVILVDGQGRPVVLNASARAILEAQDGLRCDVDGLAGQSAQATRHLRLAIAATHVGACGPEGSRCAMPRDGRRLPLLVRIVPFPPAASGTRGVPGGRLALFLDDPETPLPISRGILADVFGLTPREAELAIALAGGRPPAQVAAALRMGLGTARQHLKQIYGKTGTHDRAALVALVRSCAGR